MDAYITVKTSHPGRMAPNTALCFILSGSALALLSTNKHHTIIEILALLLLAFALKALVGYLIGAGNGYAWGKLTGMALHTTTGFLALGTGILLAVLAARKKAIATMPLWIPALLVSLF